MQAFFGRIRNTRITTFDYFFLLVRVAVAVNMCLWAGWLGFLGFVIGTWLLERIICLTGGLQPMNAVDTNLWFD